MNICPLCHSTELLAYHQDKKRHYYQCQACHLVSVPPTFYLSHEAEKAEYDKHENHADDLGYQTFL
ncbi:MAG: methyltransferase, partial [Shewanella sp.]